MLICIFSKDQFTKEELKNIFPFLAQFWNRILSNFSIFMVRHNFIYLFLYGNSHYNAFRALVFKFRNHIYYSIFNISSCKEKFCQSYGYNRRRFFRYCYEYFFEIL